MPRSRNAGPDGTDGAAGVFAVFVVCLFVLVHISGVSVVIAGSSVYVMVSAGSDFLVGVYVLAGFGWVL